MEMYYRNKAIMTTNFCRLKLGRLSWQGHQRSEKSIEGCLVVGIIPIFMEFYPMEILVGVIYTDRNIPISIDMYYRYMLQTL